MGFLENARQAGQVLARGRAFPAASLEHAFQPALLRFASVG
jgi:hypothetical protein